MKILFILSGGEYPSRVKTREYHGTNWEIGVEVCFNSLQDGWCVWVPNEIYIRHVWFRENRRLVPFKGSSQNGIYEYAVNGHRNIKRLENSARLTAPTELGLFDQLSTWKDQTPITLPLNYIIWCKSTVTPRAFQLDGVCFTVGPSPPVQAP